MKIFTCNNFITYIITIFWSILILIIHLKYTGRQKRETNRLRLAKIKV